MKNFLRRLRQEDYYDFKAFLDNNGKQQTSLVAWATEQDQSQFFFFQHYQHFMYEFIYTQFPLPPPKVSLSGIHGCHSYRLLYWRERW